MIKVGIWMDVLSGEETADFLEGIVHLDTQTADFGLDLTVSKFYKTTGRGELDFGGSERGDAEFSEIKSVLRNSDDDYGWWDLEPGSYLMEYNERLCQEKLAFLQPLPRLTRNSAVHPTTFVSELDLVPLFVSGKGISIKENSRVSRFLIFEK